MNHLLLVAIALLGMSPAAFADLTAILSPTVENSWQGVDPFTCELNGGTAPCVQFSGTITDTDTDPLAAYIYLFDVTLVPSGDSSFFTFDGTFFNNVPGVYSDDANWATDGLGNPSNTYTGPIFGVDVDPSTPAGIYNETAQFSVAGGTADPNYNGYTFDVDFTIDVPEPSTALLIPAGLVAIVAWRRRARVC